jgi:hypothetical protein
MGDLKGIATRTPVMIGDDDEVTLEHAVAMYRSLTDAELMIVPGTSHGLLVEKPQLCNAVIVEFLTSNPVETVAPIRTGELPFNPDSAILSGSLLASRLIAAVLSSLPLLRTSSSSLGAGRSVNA